MRTVLANGCFDVLHYGHLVHLQQARDMGDKLVASVTRDRAVNKGAGRPVFDEHKRIHVVRGLRCVDDSVLVDSLMEALMIVRPTILVKGPDYCLANIETQHREYCEQHGIEIRFTSGPKFSSTDLIERLKRES